MLRAPLPAVRIASALVFACCALGCAEGSPTAAETAARAGRHLNPVGSFQTEVMSVVQRGPYLEARLFGTDLDLTLFFPVTEECGQLLVPETPATYQRSGNFGRIRGDEEMRCPAVGVGSLAAWRDRRSRRTGGGAFPRGTARFSEIYRDDDVVMLRGRFPLTGMVSIPGGYDIVAFVPNTEACQIPVEAGQSSIEFRDAGDEPFRMGAGDTTCPVVGFAQPLRNVAAPTRDSSSE